MLNSRDIARLRYDVMQNGKRLVQLCAAAGLPVLVTGTVRDDEYQMDCYRRGTGGKPPATFHSVKAGLAFDICKNIKGQEYSDAAFFASVAAIAKRMGFTWGGDWKRVDKPHFQWDEYGKYSDADIIRGRYPKAMPLYTKGEIDLTAQEVLQIVRKELADRDAAIAAVNAKVATWSQVAWDKAKAAGVFDGTRPGAPLSRQEAALVLDRLELLGGD